MNETTTTTRATAPRVGADRQKRRRSARALTITSGRSRELEKAGARIGCARARAYGAHAIVQGELRVRTCRCTARHHGEGALFGRIAGSRRRALALCTRSQIFPLHRHGRTSRGKIRQRLLLQMERSTERGQSTDQSVTQHQVQGRPHESGRFRPAPSRQHQALRPSCPFSTFSSPPPPSSLQARCGARGVPTVTPSRLSRSATRR